MDVAFVDFDGVVNSLQWWKSPERAAMMQYSLHGNSHRNVDPANVAQLQRIVKSTDARIVISSAWRHSGKRYRSGGVTQLRYYLQAAGLRNAGRVVIGCTPHLEGQMVDGVLEARSRGKEIRAWLAGRDDVDRWIVIDDERHDMGDWPELVKTEWEGGGLTREIADVAIGKLNRAG